MPVYDENYLTAERYYPSQLDGQALVQNRLGLVKRDFQWRRDKTEMKECERLYKGEGISDTLDEDGQIPRVNKIERAVDDYVSVAYQNVPKVEMVASKEVAYIENPLKQAVVVEAIEDSEKAINAHIREIMHDNEWIAERGRSIKQSGVYGVGYMKIDIDDRMDTRASSQVMRLLQKDLAEWTPQDHELYDVLSKRIDISWVDARDVAMEYGRKRYDDVLRISVLERADTEALRVQYQNPDIKPGNFPWYIEEDPAGNGTITGVLTTYELEPVYITKQVEQGGQVVERQFSAWQRVKTVIAGGQLVEKEVSDPTRGPVELPIVPVYMNEAETHPYGDAIPLKLKYSEMFLNLMRVIIYKSAKNAAATTGVLIDAKQLTENDRARVQRVLNEGGLGAIEGNQKGPTNLKDIVVPVGQTQTALSRAPIEAMQNEERVFQEASQALNMEAVDRSDSGAAARAKIMASDRGKGLSIHNLQRSIKTIYERVYELIRVHHTAENVPVMVRGSDGSRRQALMNQPVQDAVPAMTRDGQLKTDPRLKSQRNPLGLVEETVEYRLNSTSLNMKPRVQGRGDLPTDPVQRFNVLMMWLQAGLIETDTFRELQLSDWIKALDNKNRTRKMQEQMRQMQQAQQAQQGQPSPGRPQQATESEEQPLIPNQPVPGQVGGPNAGSGLLALQNAQGSAEGPKGAMQSTPQEQVQ